MRISNNITFLLLFFKSFKLLKYSYICNYKLIRFFKNGEIDISESNEKFRSKFMTLLYKFPAIFIILIWIVACLVVFILILLKKKDGNGMNIDVKRVLIVNKNNKIVSGLDSNDSSIVKLTKEILYNKAIKL